MEDEIALASEQSADSGRGLQLIQYYENKRSISDCLTEVKKGGVLQRIEAKADRLFRTQQTEALAEIRKLEIERMVREEGTECFITTSPPTSDRGLLQSDIGNDCTKDSHL